MIRKRPGTDEITVFGEATIELDDAELRAIDVWRREHNVASRAEAILILIRRAVLEEGADGIGLLN